MLLLTEDDSAVKLAWQIAFRWLVDHKPVAYKSKKSALRKKPIFMICYLKKYPFFKKQ